MNDETDLPSTFNHRAFALFRTESATEETMVPRFLTAAGFNLLREAEGKGAVIWAFDEEGNEKWLSWEEFVQCYEQRRHLGFRVWTADGDDMVCELHGERLDQMEYYNFGMLQDAPMKLAEAIVHRFVRASVSGHTTLVLDYSGRTEDFDWIRFTEGGIENISELPDVLGIPQQFARAVSADTSNFYIEVFNQHILFSRRHLSTSYSSSMFNVSS